MVDQQLLGVFARSYDPPYWVIEDLLETGPASVRAAISAALSEVPVTRIEEMSGDARANAKIMFGDHDHDLQARLFLVSRDMGGALERARLAALTHGQRQRRPTPYEHPALAGLEVDEEGLVPLNSFELSGDALCVNGHAFFVLRPVPGSNAPYWLLQQFDRKDLIEAVKVRLDPLLHGPVEKLSGRHYKMDVYGRPLDWERIRTLRSDDHGCWMPGKMSRGFLRTEYAWVPHGDEVDFLCEELPVREEVSQRGSRYLHAVYGKRGDRVTHLDGAVRVYSDDELEARARLHVRNAGKAGVRIKVFRTDRPIERDSLGDIVQAFFVWNYDVARYFGAPVPADF